MVVFEAAWKARKGNFESEFKERGKIECGEREREGGRENGRLLAISTQGYISTFDHDIIQEGSVCFSPGGGGAVLKGGGVG